jgi:myosin heavy subunit
LQVPKDNYRMGNSKVFFKSGILAAFEEKRDEKVRRAIH